jgi:hypothetical protein
MDPQDFQLVILEKIHFVEQKWLPTIDIGIPFVKFRLPKPMIMIKGITKKQHVYADYSYVPLVLAAPTIADFEDDKLAAGVCRAFAVKALAISLLTDAKWGCVRLIPYKTHAILDVASGVMALAAAATPAISKNKRARNTFILMGITGLVVGGLSIIGANHKKFLSLPFS